MAPDCWPSFAICHRAALIRDAVMYGLRTRWKDSEILHAETVEQYRRLQPSGHSLHLALVESSLPGGGIRAALDPGHGHPHDPLIVALHPIYRPSLAEELFHCGAHAVASLNSTVADLVKGVEAVLLGRRNFHVTPAQAALDRSPDRADLSERERQVILMVASGLPMKQIATRLQLSVKSIEGYKLRATRKTGLRNRAEIVRFALQLGELDELAEDLPLELAQ